LFFLVSGIHGGAGWRSELVTKESSITSQSHARRSHRSTGRNTTYDQLLNAFYETYDEANRLALSLNRLKGLNNWLENKVKDLEEELYKTNEDLEHLGLIYKNSSCSC